MVVSGLRERKKARTRAQILSAAHRLIREQGFAATTIERIAAAAEVACGSCYNYFRSKNGLLAALWWDMARERLAAADERVRRATGGAAQCVELLTSFVEAAELFEPPVLREILIGAFAAPPAELAEFKRIDEAFMARLVALLDELQGAGDIRADVDLDTATTLLYGAVMSRFLIDLDRPGGRDPALARAALAEQVDLVFRICEGLYLPRG